MGKGSRKEGSSENPRGGRLNHLSFEKSVLPALILGALLIGATYFLARELWNASEELE